MMCVANIFSQNTLDVFGQCFEENAPPQLSKPIFCACGTVVRCKQVSHYKFNLSVMYTSREIFFAHKVLIISLVVCDECFQEFLLN